MVKKYPAFMEPGLERDLALARQKIAELERQVERLTKSTQRDVRSGLMFSNRQQSFEIRFREVKFQLQAMKRMGKQLGLACRYMAQGMENSDPERAADLRFIADVYGSDLWGTHDVGGVKAPDLVKHTQYYKNAQLIECGKCEGIGYIEGVAA